MSLNNLPVKKLGTLIHKMITIGVTAVNKSICQQEHVACLQESHNK
jgi:hypothetical protein